MSLFLDQKYLTLISNRLPLFSKKNDNTYNCRCIICGDSVKKARKARGYFFPNKDKLMYKCFNCDASMYFSSFLKMVDGNMFNQYSLEKYTEGKPLSSSTPEFVFEQPEFKPKTERLLDKLLISLDKLPSDHEAVIYCAERKIPKQKLAFVYFIENMKDVVQLNDKYRETIKSSEPRIGFPLYDEEGLLTGLVCRAIRGEALRYITVKITDDKPLIYGLESVDKSKDVFVVEGPIDSLFLDNCIAVAGTSFGKVDLSSLPKEKTIVVFDNQPRNKEVCKLINKKIDENYKVVIWPQTIHEKDINEMVCAGKNVKQIVNSNVYSGLEAKAKFIAWKRC